MSRKYSCMCPSFRCKHIAWFLLLLNASEFYDVAFLCIASPQLLALYLLPLNTHYRISPQWCFYYFIYIIMTVPYFFWRMFLFYYIYYKSAVFVFWVMLLLYIFVLAELMQSCFWFNILIWKNFCWFYQ